MMPVDADKSDIDESVEKVESPDDVTTGNPEKLKRIIRIAVAGCSHGEMCTIYDAVQEIEKRNDFKIDLLISCGDFQSVRNYGDLKHMKVSAKYRKLQSFHNYYSGKKKAPVLTIFVGGNHEASGYLQEMPNGGWVAPNIYYMGHASCIQFAGLRIAGLSGIFDSKHYNLGHFEYPPFTQFSDMVSVYHTRSVDVFRLKQLRRLDSSDKVDVMVTHDWPSGICDYGNLQSLLLLKPFFRDDIDNMTLGSAPSMELLHEVRPRYWLSAHLHCSFAALVPHKQDSEDQLTRFLALDKPIPRRHFLQILDFEVAHDANMQLSYDPAWLAVLRSTDFLTSAEKKENYMPSQVNAQSIDPESNKRWDFRPSRAEVDEIRELFANDFIIPENFRRTAAPHNDIHTVHMPTESYYRNPQSAEFCAKLKIRDLNQILCDQSPCEVGVPFYLSEESSSEDKTKTDVDCEEYKNLAVYDFILDANQSNEKL